MHARSALLLLCLLSAGVQAQALAPAHAPVAAAAPEGGSGDGWLDAQLADMNRYARRYPDAFADELVRYYNAPRGLVAALLVQGWTPAEVYYACALAAVGGQPCRAVAQDHGAHRDEGWAATAERLGIPAGPVLRTRLRTQLRASYGRWGRPVLPEPPPVQAPHDTPGAPGAPISRAAAAAGRHPPGH